MLDAWLRQCDGLLAMVVHDRDGCVVVGATADALDAGDRECVARLLSQCHLSTFAVVVADHAAKLQSRLGPGRCVLSVFDRCQLLQWSRRRLVVSVVAAANAACHRLLKLPHQMAPLVDFLEDNLSVY